MNLIVKLESVSGWCNWPWVHQIQEYQAVHEVPEDPELQHHRAHQGNHAHPVRKQKGTRSVGGKVRGEHCSAVTEHHVHVWAENDATT